MKINQEFSPKYWVIHDKTTYDVYIWTASKSQQSAINQWEVKNDFEDDENLECILIGLHMVELQGDQV